LRCIWCENISRDSDIEHIIPEALGCPEGFVLPGTIVCKKCNNSLAHLDRAVIDQLEMFSFFEGIPRKKSRPPSINAIGNAYGTVHNGGQHMAINMDKKNSVGIGRRNLSPFKKNSGHLLAELQKNGVSSAVSFDVKLDANEKFCRGVTKIAYSSVAFFLGADYLVGQQFDAVRNYVVNGIGDRRLVLLPIELNHYSNSVSPPMKDSSGDVFVKLRLAVYDFFVDLSPGCLKTQEVLAGLSELNGVNHGWLLPMMPKSL
jgi:hypothetical protein